MSGDRPGLARAFLDRSGWGDAARAGLAGDASNRRYERLTRPGGQRAVLMDAPPERGEDVRPFMAVTDLLRDQGLSAPRLLASDPQHGFLLIEDLGDDLFARVCADDPGAERALYEAAIDTLVHVHRHPASSDLPPYDIAVLQRESALVTDWYLPAALPGADVGAAGQHLAAELDALASLMTTDTPVTVLRDYHAENLLWLPDRDGLARVGLLDYQDALAGHPAYDVVSLLEDARRDTGADLRAAMIDRYIGATGVADGPFRAAYAALGAQRNLKIIGIFARLSLRDGKTAYPDLIPRVWDHLMQDLSHPDLTGLADFVARWLPTPMPDVMARLKGKTP